MRLIYFLIFLGLTIYFGYSEIPTALNQACGEIELCLNFHYKFFALCLSLIIAITYSLTRTGDEIKKFFLLMLTIPLLQFGYASAVNQLIQQTSIGYENYAFAYYAFLTLSLTLSIACIFFKKRWLGYLLIAVTLIATLLLAIYGLASSEAITTQLKGLTKEEISTSHAVLIPSVIFVFGILYAFIILLIHWLKNGEISPELLIKNVSISFLCAVVFLISLFSIPLGKTFRAIEIDKAKTYLNEVSIKTEKLKESQGEFARDISVLNLSEPKPLLLRNLDTKLNSDGAFYLPREDKYCMFIHDDGIKAGFHSKTNNRNWKFFAQAEGFGVDDFYGICDEGSKLYENLFADTLGLAHPDDPIRDLEMKVEGGVSKRAQTLISEQTIKERFEQLETNEDEPFNYLATDSKSDEELDDTEALVEEMKTSLKEQFNYTISSEDENTYRALVKRLNNNIATGKNVDAQLDADLKAFFNKIENEIK